MGGEKVSFLLHRIDAMGSPPRGRGKGGLTVPCEGGARITPAWAGKRVIFSGLPSLSVDHPRVGGEK